MDDAKMTGNNNNMGAGYRDVAGSLGNNGETSDAELTEYINNSPKLSRLFGGILLNPTPAQTSKKAAKLEPRHFIIILRDGHWISVFRDEKGKLKEWDSFGRDLLGNKYIDANNRAEQSLDEMNCGQRTIGYLEDHL